MWRISLIDNTTEKPFFLPLGEKELMAKQTIVTVPLRYSEGFNFMGVLKDKIAKESLLPLESYLDRWGSCLPYTNDIYAPTLGNIKLVIEKILAFAQAYPEGLWEVERAE